MNAMISLALLLCAAGPSDKKARALAEKVERFYEETRDLTTDFTQKWTYVAFGRTTEASGKVFLKKPGLLRWEYSDKRLVVLDGQSLWSWDPADNEVTVRRGFGFDQVPSEFTFLWGRGKLLERFFAKSIQRPDGLPEGEALELLPKKPSAQVRRLVFVVGKQGEVKASLLVNTQGDENRLVFSAAQTNRSLPDALFHFEPPKGAHVQELN